MGVKRVYICRQFGRGLGPSHLQCFGCPDGGPFGLGDDADEASFLHDLYDPGNILDRALVNARRLRGDHRRPHHAPMEHPGNAKVMRIGELRCQLRRQLHARHRGADDLVVLEIFGLDLGRDLHIPARASSRDRRVEALATDQLAVRNLLGGVSDDADDTIFNGQLVHGRPETLLGELQECLPCRGGRLPHLRPSPLDRSATGCDALIDCLRRVRA